MDVPSGAPSSAVQTALPAKMVARNVDAFFGKTQALRGVSLEVATNRVLAIIGPSGCGKSTFLRCLNRMHEVAGGTMKGTITLDGENIMQIDEVNLRRRVGMVFQKPNPFPTMSIFDNVAAGLRFNGHHNRKHLAEVVERCLRQAALWDEVKDRLESLGTKLSGGQQQRLTIARALSHQPEILCLDEFSIAIDPVTTMRIEDVLKELRQHMTIVLVTNLTQQARRLADRTMFLWNGEIVELDASAVIFGDHPKDRRTYEYVEGVFG